jgi:hypothetical protein
MKELIEITKVQLGLIVELNTSIQFIKECRKRLKSEDDKYLKNNRAIQRIHKIILNDIFLLFYKIIKDDSYSLNVVMKHLKLDFDDSKLKEIKSLKRKIDQLYTKNELHEIRNEYIAHIGSNRQTRTYNWEQLFELNDTLLLFYNQTRELIGENKAALTDNKLLIEILDIYYKYYTIQELKRDYIINKNEKTLSEILFI